MQLLRLLRSPTVFSIVVHGLAGLGFAGGNIMLARVLSAEEYAMFTLVIALINLGHALAPCGIDGVVIRRELDPGPRLLVTSLGVTAVVGLALAAIGAAGYELVPGYVALVFLATAIGGTMFVAAARFQRQQRFAQSLVLVQSPNFSLLVAAFVALALHDSSASMALAITGTGYVLPAVWGWTILLRERRGRVPGSDEVPWREAAAIMALNGSGLVLVQLDRLVIPHLLPLEELAPFGVLAAIVGSLFRVLQMGVTFSLVARLAAAPDVAARRRLMAAEARLVLMAVLVGSVAIWLVTEPVERHLLAGKYHLSDALILAAIAAGVAKTLNAFSIASVTVLADRRELTQVNVWGWVSVGISVAAAATLAPWGLTGVVYGVGLGWLVRAVTGLAITMRHLRGSPEGARSLSV